MPNAVAQFAPVVSETTGRIGSAEEPLRLLPTIAGLE
jgi:hypothetical protein